MKTYLRRKGFKVQGGRVVRGITYKQFAQLVELKAKGIINITIFPRTYKEYAKIIEQVKGAL